VRRPRFGLAYVWRSTPTLSVTYLLASSYGIRFEDRLALGYKEVEITLVNLKME
jgi:hypothetical protein